MRKAVITFTAILAGLFVMFGSGATSAWADGEAVRGKLSHDSQPVAGVVIKVATEAGESVGTGTSGEDGAWSVPVPAGGVYNVELDQSTLPDGLVVRNGRPVLTIRVDSGNVRNVIFPLGTSVSGSAVPGSSQPPSPDEATSNDSGGEEELVPTGSGSTELVVSLVYGGLHFGLIIALAALGLSLIFGTTGLTNFAHGELVSFGAVVAYLLNVLWLDLPVLAAGAIAVVAGGMFGWLQDRLFWGWLRRRGTGLIAMMIVSIGVSLILRYLYLYVIGGRSERFSQYVIQNPVELGPLSLPPRVLVADAIALVVLVGVSLALLLTRLGKATRAVADNPALAEASGIDVNRIIRLVWTIGGALAALAGIIQASDVGANYQMGPQILLLVFAAVVLGGLGTAFGAMVGALIVGLFIQVSTLWINPELKYVGALVVLIVILLVRPQGILGRRERIG